MFPIRDHNPSLRPAYVTYAIMTINIAVFMAMLPAFGNETTISDIYASWALVPARVSSGEGAYTFFTSMFMHAGFMHLAGNMLFLWIFGDNLEDEMGHAKYLGFYIFCGVIAGLAQYLVGTSARVPMVGASGAIAGVMGGYLLLYPKAKIDVLLIFIIFFKVIPVPAWVMLGLWFTIQILGGFSGTAQGGVAYLAHLGGFAAGLIIIYPRWLALGGRQYWDRTFGLPDNPVARYEFVKTSIPAVKRRRKR
ncbi:rhomboid family intramembrane serine protease [Pacificibacter marinus]|uniref:Rhomboid protease GluP n=1 Tax=Pacificibacter marinus TaxID=658057 RepID=A0A1Y5SRQ6_9RHOB|nr:rhomboid family intramembrane serine protease [Pacificibacter marinus]SEK66377.1 Membrane associated serine protease, rhomboid family [Pacificibacter marinus]SLN46919.1 Rhomboid protease GluP [Pacificibacter marinus]